MLTTDLPSPPPLRARVIQFFKILFDFYFQDLKRLILYLMRPAEKRISY